MGENLCLLNSQLRIPSNLGLRREYSISPGCKSFGADGRLLIKQKREKRNKAVSSGGVV
jgi:hypothetical protein